MIIVGNFNTLLTLIYRSSREIVNKVRVVLNDATDQLDLDIYRTLYPNTAEYILFNCTWDVL